MLSNAALLRIDRLTGTSATGDPILTAGNDLASKRVRCFFDGVTSSQRYTFGATIKDADLACHIDRATLSRAGEASPPPAEGDRLLILFDGDAAADQFSAEVIKRSDRITRGAGGASHYELFLRRLPLAGAINA